jgi:hypothetical protein
MLSRRNVRIICPKAQVQYVFTQTVIEWGHGFVNEANHSKIGRKL